MFVGDAFCFCIGFCLLLFSCGSQKDAVFTFPQLGIFQGIIAASVTFKILLILRLDGQLHVHMIVTVIPLLAMLLLVMACGIAISSNKSHEGDLEAALPRKKGYMAVNSTPPTEDGPPTTSR
eukprot:TRINITY_DN4076_c0_g1_i1.p1 TRINITY_DN4076_c0_g1~~TRINITY_DN4076_c0_g1_i1.p1  ORF type:complete len:122 (-),score=19.48 TRINITY_DN4076_c0_g1_i1:10-375(-)